MYVKLVIVVVNMDGVGKRKIIVELDVNHHLVNVGNHHLINIGIKI